MNDGPQKPPKLLSIPKKLLYMNLQFNRDSSAETLKNRLSHSLKKTFLAAELRLTFSTKPMIRMNVKNKLPLMVSLINVYLPINLFLLSQVCRPYLVFTFQTYHRTLTSMVLQRRKSMPPQLYLRTSDRILETKLHTPNKLQSCLQNTKQPC
uniref:Uncharacterized protein n=1 Tax=Trichobilharzia regenti TaxID=157069 RepID=A0AA85K9X6_TRIRE|nr:unnamed protein product [Trichobilharzia regenti]